MSAVNMNADICGNGAKTIKKTTHSEGAYNYNAYFYFSPFPFQVVKSIDFLTLSISRKSMTNALEIGSMVLDHVSIRETLKKGGFHSKIQGRYNPEEKRWYVYCDEFYHPDNEIGIFIWYLPKSVHLPPLYMKIHNPNGKVIRLLYRLFNSHHVQPNFSEVELTFDFFVANRVGFSDFLRNHLFLKYQRSKSFWVRDTFYPNNLRKSRRGMRSYGKEISQHHVCRMELILKKGILKKQKIDHPKDLDHLDLSRFFTFMRMDKDGLRKHEIWCNEVVWFLSTTWSGL
jgi:hypothetical protein